ncbi:MAG: hypothetical protein VR68_11595 [Peptococcaceae bacterium BRH_c4a]|nr:MAG: hypothetical protein VR68_11595 [Peptococcaceae bacterium BRH_c4a]
MPNSAPLIPSNLTPPNGGAILASVSNTFTYTFNDPGDTQSALYIEYGETIEGAVISNTGWVATPNAEHTFVSGTFTAGKEYKWRIKAKDSINQESPFSEWAVFKAANLPVATITYPAADFDEISALPTYQHALSNTQTKFQYKLTDPTIWPDIEALTWAQIEAMTWDQLESFSDALLWDSGIIMGTGTSIQQPTGYLDGNKTYKIQVQAWDIYTNSDADNRYFKVNMNLPPTPTATAGVDSSNASVVLTITNPTPQTGQPAAASNKVYRQESDGTWTLEASGVVGGSYSAKIFASGLQVTYSVSAVSAVGDESGKSTPVTITASLSDYWLVDPDTNTGFRLYADPAWGRMQSEREREEIWGVDEAFPSITYDQARYYQGSFQAGFIEDSSAGSGASPRVQAENLRTFIDGAAKKSMWLKSPFGDVFKVDMSNFKIKPKLPGDRYRAVSFDMVETASSGVSYAIGEYDLPPTSPASFWVIDPDTGRGVELEASPDWGGLDSERDRSDEKTFGEYYPTAGYGKKRAYRSSFSGYIMVDVDMPTALNKIRNLLDAPTKKPLIFMTPFGEQFLVDTYNFSFELVLGRLGLVRRVSFDFVEVGDIG